ncbi:MAG: M20/M25/M40 family metallo-hydrolase [Bacteroidota bacterium]
MLSLTPFDVRIYCSFLTLIAYLGFLSEPLKAQELANADLDQVIAAQLPATLLEHQAFVRLPNDAAFEADMPANIDWLKQAFSKRGFGVKVLETGRIPLVLAERKSSREDVPTLLFYLHFDGQPVNKAQWDQPDPFEPVLKAPLKDGSWQSLSYDVLKKGSIDPEWRVFARAAADDKAPIIMLLKALDLLKQMDIDPAFHVKVLLDGEEEKGSKGLLTSLRLYKTFYQADHLIILDGPEHPSRRPTLTFGCRGIARADVTVYGPKSSQHSGHYGNYAPNPAFRLAQLLASMKDQNGRVMIKGYYDPVQLSESVRKDLAAVPDDENTLKNRLGIAEAEAVGGNYQEALQYPSLNIPQMQTGWGMGQRTVIPDKASARLEMRLVPETKGQYLIDCIRKHIEEQGYWVTDSLPTEEERMKYARIATYGGGTSVESFRTDPASPMGQWLVRALTTVHGEEPVQIRIMGGTVPISPLIQALDIPAVIVPLVNMDNNQHAPNENIRIGNLISGIKSLMGILAISYP